MKHSGKRFRFSAFSFPAEPVGDTREEMPISLWSISLTMAVIRPGVAVICARMAISQLSAICPLRERAWKPDKFRDNRQFASA